MQDCQKRKRKMKLHSRETMQLISVPVPFFIIIYYNLFVYLSATQFQGGRFIFKYLKTETGSLWLY